MRFGQGNAKVKEILCLSGENSWYHVPPNVRGYVYNQNYNWIFTLTRGKMKLIVIETKRNIDLERDERRIYHRRSKGRWKERNQVHQQDTAMCTDGKGNRTRESRVGDALIPLDNSTQW